ncbi:hypothetical protein [Thermotalea metallivorans]|uniref:Peptidase C39-like domain-containing protein n=1 Tax=Thermotalea metallivorans TaxID=520762 RepID=A0A140LB37_9FIRM|nr:hypothetical protein [Thermotalea metallivorans]KXG77762.1 hypothetical protein AN619_03640 [Thermotalea metallivorans]
MRKVLSLLLMLMLIFSSMAYAEHLTSTPIDKAISFKDKTSQKGKFKVWKDEKIGSKRELYNSEGKLSAYLVTVESRDDKIIGYMLIEPRNNEVIEYALGQSPYDDYLDKYLEINKNKFKDKDIQLIYDGPSRYGIEIKDKNKKDKEIIAFTTDSSVEIRVDSNKDVNMLMEQKNINTDDIVTPMGYTTYSKIISGVGNNIWYRACGPTAGSNIVYYWDGKGYPNLVLSGETAEDIIDELYVDMGSINQATLPTNYKLGLKAYFDRHYNGVFNNKPYTSPTYADVKYEVDRNCPGTILYMGHPHYGEHYVTLVGYEYEYGESSGYYVIHDTWDIKDIYRPWASDVSDIEQMIGFYK